MKSFSKHLPHYLSLIGIFIVGIVGIYTFAYDRSLQMAVVVAMGVAYVVWGVVHHFIHRDLYLAVVIEYLVVAALGVVLVFSLIFRA